jgi:dihydrofolate reductase
MEVILVFVSTIDGKVTKWGNPVVKTWTSKEDQLYFNDLMKNSNLIVMWRRTYENDPVKSIPGRLMVVMTGNPEKYKEKEKSGEIIFSDQSPIDLVNYYSLKGYDKMLMVGGPQLATSFIKEKLINQIWLTLEPKIFGTGGNFASNLNLDIDLQLMSVKKVNSQGTLILKYSVK